MRQNYLKIVFLVTHLHVRPLQKRVHGESLQRLWCQSRAGKKQENSNNALPFLSSP
jgi:hypothetical protein